MAVHGRSVRRLGPRAPAGVAAAGSGPAAASRRLFLYDLDPAPADLSGQVIDGLTRRPRRIPATFTGDSPSPDPATRAPGQDPTRTELGILECRRSAIVRLVGGDCVLVGSGKASRETLRVLLEALRPRAFVPIDGAREPLLAAARRLALDHPWLDVHAVRGHFSLPAALPGGLPRGRRVAFLPGSSIGRLDPREAQALLSGLAALVGPGGGVLTGVETHRSAAAIDAARDDADGVTVAFNRRLLRRINRELGGNFDPAAFAHRACYNEVLGRIETHLVSRRPQSVRVGGARFDLVAGEAIHTASAYQYPVVPFQRLARRSGFVPVAAWTDPSGRFSVHFLQAIGNLT
jgi:dimethylhistidine N-methyltransferase